MNYTPNYQLSLWDADDRIMREDFNADNAKLDAALKAANDRIDTLGTSKANAAALGAETTARQNADTALGGRIDSEAQARQSADSALQGNLNAEATAREALERSAASQFAAMAANLGSHGHNCRIAWGSYSGNDAYGTSNPTILTFDFCPVMLLITTSFSAGKATDPAIFLRGSTETHSGAWEASNASSRIKLVWGDDRITWTANDVHTQMNSSSTYFYVVLGYDKNAETA